MTHAIAGTGTAPPSDADVELLARLLAARPVGVGARRLGRRLLRRLGGVRGLVEASASELRVAGLDAHRAHRVEAAFRLARRASLECLATGAAVQNPAALAARLTELLGGGRRERFAAVFVDARHRVLAHETLFLGTLDGAVVHVRELAAAALRSGARAVVLAHNHPSGNPEPSAADVAITRRIVDALQLLEIDVLDHIVIGAGRWVSLAARGLLAAGAASPIGPVSAAGLENRVG